MVKIVDPISIYRSGGPSEFKRSLDGQKIVAVLRRGHLDANEVEYQIVMFRAAEVIAAINAKDSSDRSLGEVLVSLRTSSGARAIENVVWKDNDTLTFIGRIGESEAGQVYSFDLNAHSLQKLTSAFHGVFTYDISARGALVYSTPVFPDWRERNRRGYVVGATTIKNLTITDPKDADVRDLAFYVKGAASEEASRIDTGLNWVGAEIGALPRPNEISISPDGRWAIVLATPRSVPASWAEYDFVREYLSHFSLSPGKGPQQLEEALAAWVPMTELAPRAPTMKQFFLVDVASASAKPLLDAPGGTGYGTHMRWSSDSARVLLAPTYMPIGRAVGAERTRRQSTAAIVEVEISSGNAMRVDDYTGRVTRLEWLGDKEVLMESGRATEGTQASGSFRKRGGRWIAAPRQRNRAQRLKFSIREDDNTPPQIVATDLKTGRRRQITDLNPQLANRTLGEVQALEWRDRENRRYRGGLVLPPGFRKDKRYPVVLQTYGYNSGEFLVTGPRGMPTAFAARAIVNKGIVVLQMPLQMPDHAIRESGLTQGGSAMRYEQDGENPRFVAMMEGAIDTLSARGIADRDRIGLIGFSRTGMHVQYAITFSTYPIAAATIAHSVQATPFAYVLSYGLPYPAGMLGFEQEGMAIGSAFWGNGVKDWQERSPAFHLDRIRTPLRLEHLSTNVPEYWDTFVQLKRHQRPVEMIHLPLAGHQVERPLERYMSQQGNVDWFAFWLKDEIDPDPAKAAQYDRWRILRKQHEAHLLEVRGGADTSTTGSSMSTAGSQLTNVGRDRARRPR